MKTVGRMKQLAAAVCGWLALSSAAIADALLPAIYTAPGELDMLLKSGHIQGMACSTQAIYLAHCEGIVKLDWRTGRVLAKVAAPTHLGDICCHDGRIYGAFGHWRGTARDPVSEIRVWDEALTPLKTVDCSAPGVRGIDGITVWQGELWVGLDNHAWRGQWDHPPHDYADFARFRLPELQPLGTRRLQLGYAIHYGPQCLGTDGEWLLIANYGAGPGEGNPHRFDFTRADAGFGRVESLRLPASEGFVRVPASIHGRDGEVFAAVAALGGNMQGWWKDPKENPPRIRIDFYAYDRATGKFTDVTDRSRDPYASTPDALATAERFGKHVVAGGFVREYAFERPDRAPIWFGGESRADDVAAAEYCVYADVIYADGTALWAQRADFRLGAHGWERAEAVVTPAKAVAKVRLYAFVRDGTGQAEFRDVFLRREAPPEGRVLASRRFTNRPYADTDRIEEVVWRKSAVRSETRDVPAAKPPMVPLADGERVVWTASSMRRITPLTFPSDAERRRAAVCAVDLARGEAEAVQVLCSAGLHAGADAVTVAIEPPAAAGGRAFDGTVEWRRQGYLPRRAGMKTHPLAAPEGERFLPAPLLPAAPFKIRAGGTQGIWLTVRAGRGATPGDYAGRVRVTADGREIAALPLKVRVRPFALPATFGLKTSFSYMDGFARPLYPSSWHLRRREAHDLLLDHRLNPDDITRADMVRVEDVAHNRARGASCWNLTQIALPSKDPNAKWTYRPSLDELSEPGFYAAVTNRLAPVVAELKRRGIFAGSYVYGFDEVDREYYPAMRRLYLQFKRDFPDLPIMTTSFLCNELATGEAQLTDDLRVADWYCGGMRKYSASLRARLHAEGRENWWYSCLEPVYPCMNFGNWEYPLIEARLVTGLATWLAQADGFLYWHSNLWLEGDGAKIDEDGDTFFPDFRLVDVNGCCGDGVFLFPGRKGVLPGIRLANLRDGVEDWEILQLAAERIGRARVAAIVRQAVRSPCDFTRDPAAVAAVREALADALGQGQAMNR